MLQQPMPYTRLLSSADNLFQFGLRCRYKTQSFRNSNNKLTVSSDQYKAYFKYAIIRNPWARVFSWYKNCLRDSEHKKRLGLDDTTSLNDFLLRNAGKGFLRTQQSWLDDFEGSCAMDFVARFESLHSDFRKICGELDIPPIDLPHEMQGSGEDYRDHFDDQCIRLVRDTYKDEIDLYGYSFER